jgi:phosphate/sulfate permease
VQWPEGFRLHPNAGWDDEIKRLSEAADVFERVANVVQSHLVGAPLPTGVAVTVAKSIIDPPPGAEGMAEVLAALVGAIAWNFTKWYFGLPTSASQALIGGLVGATIASASTVCWMTSWSARWSRP